MGIQKIYRFLILKTLWALLFKVPIHLPSECPKFETCPYRANHCLPYDSLTGVALSPCCTIGSQNGKSFSLLKGPPILPELKNSGLDFFYLFKANIKKNP